MSRFKLTKFQIAVHLGSLIPFFLLVYDAWANNLTVYPIQAATYRTGKTALVLLLLTLACSPLNRLLGLRQALTVRRALGLYTFFYASLHLLIFTVVDYGLDPQMLYEAIFKKRYALVGFAAFLLLLPLAITSTKAWMKRLGKRWTRLHNLIYPAAVLVIIHYVWLVKSDIRTPLAFGAGVVALLVLRRPGVRRAIANLRAQLNRRRREPAGAPESVKSLT